MTILHACRDPRYTVNCTTFAAPRVGNKAFVSVFQRAFPAHLRIFNKHDVVPMMPPFFGYTQPANGIKITTNKQLGLLDAQGVDITGLGVPDNEVEKVCLGLLKACDHNLILKSFHVTTTRVPPAVSPERLASSFGVV